MVANIGPTWVEVDLDAVAHNLKIVRQIIRPGVKVMAVVKADAYGHGALSVAELLVNEGIEYLGVFTLQEAVELRAGGIKKPIVLLGAIAPDQAAQVVSLDIEASVSSVDVAEALGKAAIERGKRVRVHVEVDTGMNRFGIRPCDAESFMDALGAIAGIEIYGLYTHFAHHKKEQNRRQLRQFQAVISRLDEKGLRPKLLHAANSTAMLTLPESHFDMVRVGNILYGIAPGVPSVAKKLQPTWRLKSKVVQLRQVAKGQGVGYGSDFIAPRDMKVAVLAVGLADGFMLDVERPVCKWSDLVRYLLRAGIRGWRMLRNGNGITVRNVQARLVGRVGMQHCVIDVSNIKEIRIGDMVSLPCRWTAVPPHVPRVYIREGQPNRIALPVERQFLTLES
ncbi:MAG: alanine racemase [Peptococcaceae bacterium]|nr:alanine racemase [Peptococcaceae bacterium]